MLSILSMGKSTISMIISMVILKIAILLNNQRVKQWWHLKYGEQIWWSYDILSDIFLWWFNDLIESKYFQPNLRLWVITIISHQNDLQGWCLLVFPLVPTWNWMGNQFHGWPRIHEAVAMGTWSFSAKLCFKFHGFLLIESQLLETSFNRWEKKLVSGWFTDLPNFINHFCGWNQRLPQFPGAYITFPAPFSYGDGSKPISINLNGMNIHESQLFLWFTRYQGYDS